MIGTIRRGAAKLTLALALFSPQVSSAETTTADFLTWERSAQDSFIQTSLSMTGVLVSQVRPEMAKCLDSWYFESKAKQDIRHSEILDVMPQYAEFDPQAVLLGYIESVCGRIDGS
ncbi:MAG: hypothetical protein ABJV68_06840 [Paracoccaceae bacterium]